MSNSLRNFKLFQLNQLFAFTYKSLSRENIKNPREETCFISKIPSSLNAEMGPFDYFFQSIQFWIFWSFFVRPSNLIFWPVFRWCFSRTNSFLPTLSETLIRLEFTLFTKKLLIALLFFLVWNQSLGKLLKQKSFSRFKIFPEKFF